VHKVTVVEVAQAIYEFDKAVRLELVVENLSDHEMAPEAKKGLVNHIQKLARYRQASNYLWKMVQEKRIFRSVTVHAISPPIAWFTLQHGTAKSPSLKNCLARVQNADNRVSLGAASEKLGVSKVTAQKTFETATRRVWEEAKIHAEIQVVAFLEQSPPSRRPRIICSTKDACYLCNAFMRLHGNYLVPKSHGMFYPGWRLPLDVFRRENVSGLNDWLELAVRDNLKELMGRDKRLPISPVNESTIFSLPPSTILIPSSSTSSTTRLNVPDATPTLVSTTRSPLDPILTNATTGSPGNESGEPSGHSITTSAHLVSKTPKACQSGPVGPNLPLEKEEQALRSEEVVRRDLETSSEVSLQIVNRTPMPPPPDRLLLPTRKLRPGEPFVVPLSRGIYDIHCLVGSLGLFVEITVEDRAQRQGQLLLQAEWLKDDDDFRSTGTGPPSIDVASMSDTAEVATRNYEYLYLALGKQTMRMRLFERP